MKVVVFLFLLLVGGQVYPQKITIDTLKNAVAISNNYNTIPIYGKTSSGNVYGAGINFVYDEDGKPLSPQFARIDFGTKAVTYKFLSSVISDRLAFWNAVFDGIGNMYLSLKGVPQKKVIQFNLKDSIRDKDLGNPFLDGVSWAYCMSLGRDNKMYFGGSSRGSTNWSVFDPKTNSFEKHPSIDPDDDFVLSIAGDSNYVYAQTGQRKAVQLWSIRKKDDYKKSLGKISNTRRIALETREDGIYALLRSDTLTGWFKLVNGDTVRVTNAPVAKKTAYEEVNKTEFPNFNSVFDPTKNKIYYSLDNKHFDTLSISLSSVRIPVSKIFSFPNDKENIYFAGREYGGYYQYNLKTSTSYFLGTTGYNIYSKLALNDSIMFFGGYPNGYLMKWNRNQPWTTQQVINGKLVIATDAKANPRIMGFWKSKSKPPAGFHHTAELIFDGYNNIVGAGDVIRIGNAASIGVYNMAKDSMYGIAYNAYSRMGYSSITRWKKLIIYAMRNQAGAMPKLYFYNSFTNSMADSMDLGYDDYGKIFVQGDILTGISSNREYKIDLSQKKLVDVYKAPNKLITSAYFLSNGKAIVTTLNNTPIPSSIVETIVIPYFNHDILEANGFIYAVKGFSIVRAKIE